MPFPKHNQLRKDIFYVLFLLSEAEQRSVSATVFSKNHFETEGSEIMKRLILNRSFCKGCGICAAFCPKEALAIENGKAVLKEPENCILCGQCEARCPDYAIFIDVEQDATA